VGVTRNISAGLIASLDKPFYPIVFVEIDWPTGRVRVNSSSKVVNALGSNWSPVGSYGSISIPQESISIGNPTATLKLAGDLSDLLDELDQDPRNSAVEIYFGTLTSQTSSTVTGDPTILFSGYVDGVDFDFSRESDEVASSSVTVSVASGPSPRSYASISHSQESQKFIYPTDTAGRQVVNASKKALDPDAWPEL
jgi:hypothetical protein